MFPAVISLKGNIDTLFFLFNLTSVNQFPGLLGSHYNTRSDSCFYYLYKEMENIPRNKIWNHLYC